MKKLSPVVVAFVSFCLISFHSNPAFAAVIDAVAPPEDAVAVPLELEEPDDATGKWKDTELANNAQQQRERSKSIVVVLFCFVLCCFVSSVLNNFLVFVFVRFVSLQLQLQLLRSSMPFRRKLRPFLVVVVVVHWRRRKEVVRWGRRRYRIR